jgi:hypothetical protein
MASIIKDPAGVKRIGFVDRQKKPQSIYLGKVLLSTAREWKDKVGALNAAAKANASFAPPLIEWLGKLAAKSPAWYDKLTKVGLVMPRPDAEPEAPAVTLAGFLDACSAIAWSSTSEQTATLPASTAPTPRTGRPGCRRSMPPPR